MSKRSVLNFNQDIIDLLNENKVPLKDGTSYLVLIYYQLFPSYIPDKLITKINSLNIFTKNYNTNEIVWNIPLFEEGETHFEWITDFINKFRDVNPSRKGIKKDCLLRMKKLFKNNPNLTKEIVMEATDNYISTINNPQYIKLSHKFIEEEGKVSMLMDYVNEINNKRKEQELDFI